MKILLITQGHKFIIPHTYTQTHVLLMCQVVVYLATATKREQKIFLVNKAC